MFIVTIVVVQAHLLSEVIMPFYVGSSCFPACISKQKITDILNSDIPLKMSLWDRIKEFFFTTHQAEAQDCLYRICHPSAGTTPDDVRKLFERLKELAHPGYADNIQCHRYGGKSFCIMDKNGDELLSVSFADDYTVTTGTRGVFFADGTTRIYPLHP
ncbi:hypothetical protein F9271_10925 [Salmonella enterica]|uniref:Secreted effector protein n=1 Tax=Salmonella enterica TaxID=28901 RepID=A0A403MY87_SALER|nr:hypothetical protein [Salmonella enterica]ECC8969329.1 hypothetical protein [Salmonella enterica subsp. diarizonae]EDN4534536.1 hypothetical protein [Salmonella enterica subsp. diarizonae serovar 47:k:z35]EDQ3840391.1 hypothetical protein [Salmonella enterica subsp. enterica serovar Bareilly]EAZ3149380.1 hypothetical protein [Salmonella enterica]